MVFTFAEFELDDGSFELRRRGARVELQPKVMDLLVFLLKNRGRLVTKEELLEALWPDVTVSEASLTRAMKELRRAVDDDGEKQAIVETVRGRGYKFVASVQEGSPAPALPTSAPVPTAPATPQPQDFFGRVREVALMTDLVTSVEGGAGARVLVLHGPVGVGKTRLLRELVSIAKQRGFTVLRARPSRPEATAQALSLWRDALRALRDDARVAARASAVLANLGGAALASDITEILEVLTAEHPVALVFDDLGWADEPSLAALSAAVRSLPDARLLVAVAHRDSDAAADSPLAKALGDLLTDTEGRSLEVAGLDDEAIERWVTAATGAAPHPAVARSLRDKTRGAPLALAQLIAELSRVDFQDKGPDALARSIQLSSVALQVLARQIDTLGEECRDLLAAASVVGNVFTLPPLARATQQPQERILDLLGEAARARLVAKPQGALGETQFASSLLRDVLYKRVPPATRTRLHAAAGEALLEVYGAESDVHVEAIATHLLNGVPVTEPRRAVALATQAGRRASGDGRHRDAAWFFDGALTALRFCEGADERTKLELLLALGQSRREAGDPTRAEAAFEAARAVAKSLGDDESLARASAKT